MRATEFLIEGGNVFDGTSDIDQKFAPNLTSAINKALSGTGINVITVGSAATPTPGKMSGDFDVMADETAVANHFKAKDAKSARKALADYFRSKGFDVAQTGTNVHVKTPIGQKFAQVDIMVVPQAEKISKLHIHNIPKGSPYKGYNKQLAIHFLSKMKGYFWSAWQGLYARTPEGKKGELVSNDIDIIAKTLLGSQATAADLGSVESIMNALPKDQADELMATLKADANWKEVQPTNEIVESKGLFGRKVGDVFTNDNGEQISFQTVEMFPSTKLGAKYDPKKLDAAIAAIEKKTGQPIEWVNKRSGVAGAFALATLTSADNKKIHTWGRWYNTVPGSLLGTWKNTEVPGGWKLMNKTAQKVRSGLTPQDLIKTDAAFKGSASVIATVEQNGADPTIVAGLNQLAAGQLPKFQGQAKQLEAVRDYLGEVMQPIGLMSGVIKGDAEIARTEILKTDWKNCALFYPQAKNYNLIDSYFRAPNGVTVGISSKGGKGADASVLNIQAAIKKAEQEGKADLIAQHKTTVDIINIIASSSVVEGPLKLGVKYRIISAALANEIREYLKITTKNVRNLSPEAKQLFKMYGSDSTIAGYSVGFVLLANTAKLVADRINRMKEFSDGCLAFLNQSSIVQIYTDAKAQGDDVAITGFRAVYPPNFTGRVLINGGKNYYSTRASGRMAFSYKPK